MVIHYIVLSSSYSTRSRIALHRAYHERIDHSEVGPMISRIESCFGGAIVQIGVHIMQTRSDDWGSVTEEDPYFMGVRVIDSVDGFIQLIKRDEFLKGIDVARYILKTVPCTHSRVNILTYMCYADYLCDTGRRLFTDGIHASVHGPVVQTVRDGLGARQGHPYIEGSDAGLDDETQVDVAPSRMSVRSRILFAANGSGMLYSIDATLDRCRDVTTGELADLTHRGTTPWSMADSGGLSAIPDDVIKRYHRNESPRSVVLTERKVASRDARQPPDAELPRIDVQPLRYRVALRDEAVGLVVHTPDVYAVRHGMLPTGHASARSLVEVRVPPLDYADDVCHMVAV